MFLLGKRGYVLSEHSLCTSPETVFSRMYKDGPPAADVCWGGCTREVSGVRLQGYVGSVAASGNAASALHDSRNLKPDAYLSAKRVGRSGTRPRSCMAFIPRVRRSRSSLLSTSRPVSSPTRSRRWRMGWRGGGRAGGGGA